MLNTYIKNIGSSQTIIGNSCKNHMEEIDWDADYDGDKAKILIRTNSDGDKQKYHFTLDNADLANLLKIDSVNMPIHKRLKADFRKPVFRHEPNLYRIELPTPESSEPSISDSSISDSSDSFSELIQSSPNSFLSSPSSNDEFIVPVTLNQGPYKKYTFTPKRRNLTLKTHKTHRIFKRPKKSLRRRYSRRSSSRRRPSYR